MMLSTCHIGKQFSYAPLILCEIVLMLFGSFWPISRSFSESSSLSLSLFMSKSHFHSARVCHCIAKIHIVFLCIFVSLTFFSFVAFLSSKHTKSLYFYFFSVELFHRFPLALWITLYVMLHEVCSILCNALVEFNWRRKTHIK